MPVPFPPPSPGGVGRQRAALHPAALAGEAAAWKKQGGGEVNPPTVQRGLEEEGRAAGKERDAGCETELYKADRRTLASPASGREAAGAFGQARGGSESL